jgi:hypothetical protein
MFELFDLFERKPFKQIMLFRFDKVNFSRFKIVPLQKIIKFTINGIKMWYCGSAKRR